MSINYWYMCTRLLLCTTRNADHLLLRGTGNISIWRGGRGSARLFNLLFIYIYISNPMGRPRLVHKVVYTLSPTRVFSKKMFHVCRKRAGQGLSQRANWRLFLSSSSSFLPLFLFGHREEIHTVRVVCVCVGALWWLLRCPEECSGVSEVASACARTLARPRRLVPVVCDLMR